MVKELIATLGAYAIAVAALGWLTKTLISQSLGPGYREIQGLGPGESCRCAISIFVYS